MSDGVDLSALAAGDAIVFDGRRLIAIVLKCRPVGWLYSVDFLTSDFGDQPVRSSTLFHKSGTPAIPIFCPAIVQVIKRERDDGSAQVRVRHRI